MWTTYHSTDNVSAPKQSSATFNLGFIMHRFEEGKAY